MTDQMRLQAKRGRKGPRPKHVPQRMCVSCRDHAAKRGLVRIVRTPAGTVQIDLTGKLNGRGAYLCDRPACWERALKTQALARALNTELGPEALDALRNYAAALPQPVEAGAAELSGKGTNHGEHDSTG